MERDPHESLALNMQRVLVFDNVVDFINAILTFIFSLLQIHVFRGLQIRWGEVFFENIEEMVFPVNSILLPNAS